MKPLALLTLAALALTLGAAPPCPTETATSDVLRFTIAKLVDGHYDLEVVLFHRDGVFHHGYALVPDRDNLAHRVDPTPSRPIQWQTADGTPLDVPEKMRGYYSYKRPEFASYKQRFAEGKIRAAYPIPTPPIAWDGRRLTGNVDVLIGGVDTANVPGRGPLDVPYRIVVDATGTRGGALKGSYTLWTYAENDDTYGAEAERTKGDLAAARWATDAWKPAPESAYADGTDWPQARGPELTGAAADCARPLIRHLHDARLLWVGEEVIGGGRGAVLSRGGFAMYPYAWQNIGYAGFAGPTIVGGKVYQVLLHPDEERVAKDPEIAANVYVQLGADPRTMAGERGHLRDTVLCLDARTGRTLWWWRSEQTVGDVKAGKGGIGTTACILGGRVYARGATGLVCLDAETGDLLWLRGGGKVGDTKVGYGLAGSWSHDMSPVAIGGVLVMTHGGEGSLCGVDPKTGDPLWSLPRAGGYNAVPTRVVLDGTPYVLVGSGETQRLSLIRPADGEVLWTSDLLGANPSSLCVWEGIVCGNGTREGDGENQGDTPARRAAAVNATLSGATPRWTANGADYPSARSVPVAHRGCFYIDDRAHFWCLDAATGKVLGRQPHIYHMTYGSHNWVWTIASNDRVFTSGVLMFSTGADGFERLPGRLSLDLAGGYMCPIKPAMADGRLVCRLGDKLVCYDMRKDPTTASRTVELTCPEAYTSSVAEHDAVRLRIRFPRSAAPEVAAKWPEIVGPEAGAVNNWAAGYARALPWRSYPADGLALTDEGLRGNARVPMGWHYEQWTLDLARDGDTLAGTFTRAVPAVDDPVAVAGKIGGKVARTEAGETLVLEMDGAATQLQRNRDTVPLTVALVRTGEGLRGWACAGKVNGVTHEVAPSGLVLEKGRLAGTLTVLFRNDRYFYLNAEAKTAVAATYEVDATVADGAVTGTFSGTVGEAWSHTGRARGRIDN